MDRGIIVLAIPVEDTEDRPAADVVRATLGLLAQAVNVVGTPQAAGLRFRREDESLADALNTPGVVMASHHEHLRALGFTPEDLGLVVAYEDGEPVRV